MCHLLKVQLVFRGTTHLKNSLFCRVVDKCGGKVAGQHT